MEKRHKTAAKCGSKTPESTEAPQAIETPESTTPAEASVTAEDVTSTAASLTAANIPAEYLCGGYYKGEGKTRYPDPNLVGETAQTLAHDLAAGGLRQSTLNPILRDLKKANKKTLPLDAKHGALSGDMDEGLFPVQAHHPEGLHVRGILTDIRHHGQHRDQWILSHGFSSPKVLATFTIFMEIGHFCRHRPQPTQPNSPSWVDG